MKLLVDMPIARRVADELRADGHDAIHLGHEGLSRLSDDEIFAKAMAEGRIIVTADLDFGAILARTGSATVSVIVLRIANPRADWVVTLVRRVLADTAAELIRGALCWSRRPASAFDICPSATESCEWLDWHDPASAL